MRRRLLAGFLLFGLVVVPALEVPLGISLADSERTTAISALQRDAESLAVAIGAAIELRDPARVTAVATRYAQAVGGIVAIIPPKGAPIGAGRGFAEELRDPRTAGIVAAASHGRVLGVQGSQDPDDNLLYVAIPIGGASEPRSLHTVAAGYDSVLLVAVPAGPLDSRIAHAWLGLALFGAGALALALILGAVLAASLTRPLATIETAVEAFGEGRFTERAGLERGPPELVNLARTVNDMAGRIDELLRAQRAFVADASHQLRAPMTALRLRLENLESEVSTDQAVALGAVLDEADRLSHIVDGLLALMRAEGTRPSREAVDVAGIVHDRASAWRALAEERSIELKEGALDTDWSRGTGDRGGGAGPANALACPGHLDQILDNLLANALEATPPGGTVTLSWAYRGEEVEVRVSDTGPGMSTAELARAFDRFWRPEGAAGEGTGLGLAIVAQLARASGATAELSVASGGGTEALVVLEAT